MVVADLESRADGIAKGAKGAKGAKAADVLVVEDRDSLRAMLRRTLTSQ